MTQFEARLGQAIFIARRMLVVSDLFEDRLIFQPFQPVGEDIARKLLGGIQEFIVSALALKNIADDEQRPAVTDDIERESHRTI